MKITPLDIQHKVFETKFRGYERRQVDQFLEEGPIDVHLQVLWPGRVGGHLGR